MIIYVGSETTLTAEATPRDSVVGSCDEIPHLQPSHFTCNRIDRTGTSVDHLQGPPTPQIISYLRPSVESLIP